MEAERRAADGRTGTTAGAGDWDLPDLLVVDGGRGQLQIALSAAHDLGLHGLAIVGLAKERETVTGEKMVDRVYMPGQKNGIPLRPTSAALFFLARARDEAHRFANHVRKRLGKSRRLRSDIEDIPGLGAAVRTALLRELGSLEAVRRATDEQILAVSGVTKRHLTALRRVIPAPERS
jgi:excinuclease ABC subunit C